MLTMHLFSFWVVVAIAAPLLTACNPIVADSDMLTAVPTSAPEREPMQASLHDFAFVFADIDG